jgi:fibronectin-binding autotransporter adhesin
MKTSLKTIRALLLAGLAPLLAASAFAANGTWGVDAAGTWSTGTNWAGSIIPDGVGSTANLTYDITAARTVTLNAARTVGILNIGDPSASPFAYTLNNSGGAALTLDNNGSAAQINISGASANNVISAPLQLTAGGLTITSSATALGQTLSTGTITSVAGNGTQTITLTHNGGNNFVISNNISDGNTGGAIAFLLDAGRLNLAGNNSYTGGTTIRSGTLMLGTTGASALAGDINMGTASTGASSVAFHPFGRTLAGNIAVNAAGNGTMTIETYGTLNGNISLGRTLGVTANGGAMVLNGNISGSGLLSLSVNGGTLATNAVTLNGTNTGTGGVKMGGSDVTFKIGNANALGNGTLTIGPNNTTHDTALAIDNTSGSSLTLAGNNPQIWEGFIFKGTNDMNMGTGNVTINTAGSQSAIVTVQQNKLTVGGVISGASASLGNAGAGTLALQGANTYTGATSVGGILAVTSLANGNSTSNIGQSTNAAANLILNRGTLQYAGGAVTTDRLFTIGNGNATIDSSGSGAMVFNNAGANVSTDTVSLNFSTNAFSTNATTIIVAPTTNGTNTTRDLAVGQTISGVGIAGGTTITGILNEYQITISAATTANATASAYTFSSLNRTLTLTGNNTGANTISGILANSASTTLGVTKSGAGTWVLAAANTYTGATTVTTGTLLVSNTSGSGLGSGNATVNGGTLGGSGGFSGTVTVNSGGILAPGSSIQSLASGALTFNTGATFGYELDQSVGLGVGADLQVVTGNLDLNGTVTLTLTKLAGGTFANNTKFSLINYTGSWDAGLFTYSSSILTNGSTFAFNGQNWQIDYNATVGGSNFTSDQVAGNFVNITAVPEPATWALLAFSLTTVMVLRRRRE